MTSKFTLISWLRWSMAHSAGPCISTQALTSCPKNHPRCTLWCYHQPAVGQAHTISAWSGKPQKRKLRDLIKRFEPKVCIGVTHTKLIWTQNHPETYSSRKISPQSFPHWSLIKSGYEANLQEWQVHKSPMFRTDCIFLISSEGGTGISKIEHFNPKRCCLKTYCRYPISDGLSSCFKKQTAREHTSCSFIFRSNDWKRVPESNSVVELLQYPSRLHGKAAVSGCHCCCISFRSRRPAESHQEVAATGWKSAKDLPYWMISDDLHDLLSNKL